jgi:hypothetical protein
MIDDRCGIIAPGNATGGLGDERRHPPRFVQVTIGHARERR